MAALSFSLLPSCPVLPARSEPAQHVLSLQVIVLGQTAQQLDHHAAVMAAFSFSLLPSCPVLPARSEPEQWSCLACILLAACHKAAERVSKGMGPACCR